MTKIRYKRKIREINERQKKELKETRGIYSFNNKKNNIQEVTK